MEEKNNSNEENKRSGDSPNSSCAMSLGDFSMASLGEFCVSVCSCLLLLCTRECTLGVLFVVKHIC